MMSNNVFFFKPKESLTAKENLDTFISECREKLIVFGAKEDVNEEGVSLWVLNDWETTRGDKTVKARFSTNTQPSNAYSFTPLAQPFLEFAKAYIKYIYTDKPVSSLANQLLALRVVEQLLIEVYGEADILKLDGRGLTHIAKVVSSLGVSSAVANKMGYQLEKFLTFCRTKLITPSLPSWSNIYPKMKDVTIDLDEKAKEVQSEKLPSDEEMMVFADLFREAPKLGIEAEYYTSLFAFLMVAPSRASELFELTIDPFVWETDQAGNNVLGVRWYPAKKGDSGIKWVPTCMQEVLIEAHKRLLKISQPARDAAQFAIDYPNEMPLPNGQRSGELLNPSTALTFKQFHNIMGSKHESKFPKSKWLKGIRDKNNGNVTYQALGAYFYSVSTKRFKKWPKLSVKQANVEVSQSLLLHREHEFHQGVSVTPYSFTLPNVNSINDRIGGRDDVMTLFEKYGFKLKNGSYPRLKSHQPRHWLNTKAQSGGMDELLLARWSGRAKLADNRSYDHRTEEEKSRELALLMNDDEISLPVKIEANLPVTFREIGKDLDGAAIVTELGVCEHDYAMTPCSRHGDCETCKELVCIKGFSSSLEQLKIREKEVEIQLEKANTDHEKGAFGADRWVSSHAWRLAHIRTKIILLEDDRIPEGTPIRIPEQYDPSPVKEALNDKGYDLGIVDAEAEALAQDVLNLLEL